MFEYIGTGGAAHYKAWSLMTDGSYKVRAYAKLFDLGRATLKEDWTRFF